MDAHAALLTQLTNRMAGLTLEAQAEKIGVSQSFWWKVVHGEKRMGKRTLNRIRANCKDLESLAIAVLLDGGK
jgi:transcriptional regulator with XRE-family HTH domain